MNYAELKRKLKQTKCRKVFEGKEHEKWYCPETKEYFIMSRHKNTEVPPGTLHQILKSAGLK